MSEMTKIVKTITNITYPLILIFGLYIILHGHITPGGGFQGGAVVATAIALVIVTYGPEKSEKMFKEKILSAFESIGGLGFVLLALLGLIIGTVFFNNFLVDGFIFGNQVAYGVNSGDINTAGIIPLMNVFVAIKVIAGLSTIVLLFSMGIKEGSK